MSTEQDKFLAEAMGYTNVFVNGSGEMFGQLSDGNLREYICRTFNDWRMFGILWEWAQEQEWWVEFDEHMDNNLTSYTLSVLEVYPWLIHPERFANVLCIFLKSRESKEDKR